MRELLVIFPTTWDRRQLEACAGAWRDRFSVRFATPTDEECPADFDILGYVDRSIRDARGNVAGVFSSSDYPGAVVAAAITTALGLPGARPETVLQCAHKYASRQAQSAVTPEAVPAFALVDPAQASMPLQWVRPRTTLGSGIAAHSAAGFPCFVKPVKGAFSVLSRRVESQLELAAFLERDCVREFTADYLGLFHRLQERYAPRLPAAQHFLAEELLAGDQVTVEGFATHGTVEILGIVDSVMYPETRSFARFEYPSALPDAVQARMADIARRVIRHIGLDATLFNIEMTYDAARDCIGIIEINPRMCGQFADLYAKVDGTNGYEVALALAAGERPVLQQRAGRYRAAASFPLRVFEPVGVRRAPSEPDVRAAEALFPDTLVWVECEAGQSLCDFDAFEDGCSARYAVVNLGAPDRESLPERCEAVRSRLDFDLEPAANSRQDPAGSMHAEH